MAKEKNLSESLRYIYERFGIEAFLNDKKIYSLLIDLIPGNKMEINWLIDAINIGAVKPLVETQKDNLNKEECKNKMIGIFRANEISKDRTMYIVNCLFYGVKWTDKIVSLEDIKAQREQEKLKEQQNTNNVKNKKTIKNSNNTQKQNTTKNNTQNQRTNTTNNKKNVVDWNKKPENKARLNTLENSYDSLYKIVDGFIQNNKKSNTSLHLTRSNYINMAVSGLIILTTFIILVSYLLLLKEGYVDKKILILDLIAFAIGIKLIIGKSKDFVILKNKLAIKALVKKYINLRDNLNLYRNNIKSGLVKSEASCKQLENLLVDYNKQYSSLNQSWKDKVSTFNKTRKAEPAKLLIVATIIIFLISGKYEPLLVLNGDTFVHKISRSVISNFMISYERQSGCVIEPVAYIREKPDSMSDLIINKNFDESISLTGKTLQKDLKTWYQVDLEYDKGWIDGDSISVTPETVTVIEQAANLRMGPSLNALVATVCDEGTVLNTTGKVYQTNERTWYEVYLNGQRGYWISSKVVI